jgi:hypothetical protein
MSFVGRIVKRRHWTMPFGAGDYVSTKVDPRHIGRVERALGIIVTIKWPNGWWSEHWARELNHEERPE